MLQLRRKVRLLAGANAHWAPRTPASDAQMAADWVKQGGLFMSTHSVLDELEQQESVRQSLEEPLAASNVIPSVAPTRYRALFEDSLLETGSRHRRRRTWPTILSFILQCFLVSVLVLVPLWYTDVLPRQQLVTFLVAPPPPPPPPPPAPAVAKIIKVASDLLNGQLRTPSSIPSKVEMLKEAEAPPADVTGGVLGGVPGGIPGGQLGGVIGGIISSTSNLAAVPKLSKPAPTAQRVRVSQGVTQGMLTYRYSPNIRLSHGKREFRESWC